MTRASMLLSMLLVALLGQPAAASVASETAAPARPKIEISLAETLRALPVGTASAQGGLITDDGGSGDGPPLLPLCPECPAAPAVETAYSFLSAAPPAESGPTANRARAPPAT